MLVCVPDVLPAYLKPSLVRLSISMQSSVYIFKGLLIPSIPSNAYSIEIAGPGTGVGSRGPTWWVYVPFVIHIITDCYALEPSVNVISNLYNITPCLIATE